MIELALLLLGLLVTTVFATVGLAGGLLIVPILVLGFGLPAQKAVGVSLMMMTFATISATIAYARQRRINYRIGILLDMLDVPKRLVGGLAHDAHRPKRPGRLVRRIFHDRFSQHPPERNGRAGHKAGTRRVFGLPTRTIYFCPLASFASGVVAGMFGAGGGTVDITVMILVLGMSPYIAAGTSEFGMALTNTAALIPHLFFETSCLDMLPITAGDVVGA